MNSVTVALEMKEPAVSYCFSSHHKVGNVPEPSFMSSGFKHMCFWLCVAHAARLESGDRGHRLAYKTRLERGEKAPRLQAAGCGENGAQSDPSQELG